MAGDGVERLWRAGQAFREAFTRPIRVDYPRRTSSLIGSKIMTKEEYAILLRDTRWQSRRLEIIKRDDYQCQGCQAFDGLQVHHRYYENGKMPWDYPDEALVTLCLDCHPAEHDRPTHPIREDGCFEHISVVIDRVLSSIRTEMERR